MTAPAKEHATAVTTRASTQEAYRCSRQKDSGAGM
jgi:hypothetical protein